MILYFKYFFLFSKLSHYYMYFFFNVIYFLNFNIFFFINLKNIISNYCNILVFLLKTFKNNFLFNKARSLSINSLLVNTQISKMFLKNSFQNIFVKNILNKDHTYLSLSCSSIFDLLFLFNDFFIFLNRRISIKSFNNLIEVLKLNYYLLLINSNWHLILNLNSVFSSIRSSLITVSSTNGSKQYGIYSPIFLWKFWNNFFFLIINISFYNVQVLSFSKIYFKKLVDSSNWLMWSLSFFFWKMINKNFFFKYSNKNKKTLDFFRNFKSWYSGLTFILDINFHFSIIQIFNKYNIFNFALIDVNHEPWLVWYPIPCRASDITLQYIFIVLTFKIRLLGLNLFFFCKFYFLYIIRLLNFFFYCNNLVYSIMV